jgi:DNA topoisomerase-1
MIAKLLKTSDSLYLATDPDREGEAISWHVQEDMIRRKLLKNKNTYRIFFNEITKAAVQEALSNPRDISMDMVNAQQARRALDYLVGFNLSPLLWKKVRRGLSAGRVQSPALRLIVERELEIEKFITQEYWRLTASIQHDKTTFSARLTHFEGEKLEQFSITTEDRATHCQNTLLEKANGTLTVKKIEKKQRKRNPAPPFITSTLQQEAARKLGFTTRRTMSVAQQLYEGIDIGAGTVGLITYMRTDSVNLAGEAIESIRSLIEKRYGIEFVPESPRVYKTKSKNAQEAHEAIRPTAAQQTPDIIKEYLNPEQFKLYSLIWKRAVASQMQHALIDTVAIDFNCEGNNIFRANGSTIKHPGFMSVYLEGIDDKEDGDGKENILPPLTEGQCVQLDSITPSQHFTEPPPRYTEASLVKSLEEHDIGRPSTYSSIIQTLQHREYVILEKKRFTPTDVGRIVNRFLTEHFSQYVDYDFTAALEDQLDEVARGEKKWIPVLENFWMPFIKQITHIDETVQRKDVTTELIDKKCPKCDHQLAIRLGKRGRFIGCTHFPDCDYTSSLDGEETSKVEILEDRACPKCGGELHIKMGKYGKFVGCGKYPDCNHMEPIEKPTDTKVLCPQCSQGNILERRSRRGKVFYSCARYPDCDYAIWNLPLDEPCPKCHWPILSFKETKSKGKEKVCPQKTCQYKISLDEVE